MNKNRIIIILISLMLLSSCKSVKEGLSGRKEGNSDEFLVQKKNPLVLPPDFEKLPKPNSENIDDEIEEETNIENIILSSEREKVIKKSKNRSIEDFILDNKKKD